MSFEQNLNRSLFSGQTEKTFIDKILAKEEVLQIKELVKKERLTRSELLELLYLISGTESKLVNYSEWDRYIILKYFVWVREFIKVAELLYDYEDRLKVKEKEGKLTLSGHIKTIFDNCSRLIEHNAKFLIDLYLNIARTSLSIDAKGIEELLKNKYEVVYPQGQGLQTGAQENRGGIFNFRK